MTTETETRAAGAPAASRPTGLAPGLNPVLGAAVHHDLYKRSEDAAAAAAKLRSDARKLGLGFFVFFSVLIGGISLSLNGLLWKGGGVAVPPGDLGALPLVREGETTRYTPGEKGTLELEWSDGCVAPLVEVKPWAAPAKGEVALVVGREKVAVLKAASSGPAPMALVWRQGDGEQHSVRRWEAAAGPRFAWGHARLAGLVPTRGLVIAGAALGLLGLLLPALMVPIYTFWMKFVAAPLGWFNTRLILGIAYFLLFTPMAFLLRLSRDPLRRAPLPPGESYWLDRRRPREARHFERPF